LFISAIAARIEEQLASIDKATTKLIFTAHSIPVEMSGAAEYAQQVAETAGLAAAATACPNWEIAFQSRSGNPEQAWLEPDVRDAILKAAAEKYKRVAVVPVGFVCDHVEVLFDLDVQAQAVAREAGVEMLRVGTVGSHPHFIALLAELVKTTLGSQLLSVQSPQTVGVHA